MINYVKASGDQAKEIWQLLAKGFGTSPWTLAQIETDLLQSHYYLAYLDQDLAGVLVLSVNDFEEEITQILVDPAYRGRGLAKGLLKHLDARKDCFLEVRLSNLVAQSLYKSQGFEEVGRRKDYYHDPLEDALVMRRKGHD